MLLVIAAIGLPASAVRLGTPGGNLGYNGPCRPPANVSTLEPSDRARSTCHRRATFARGPLEQQDEETEEANRLLAQLQHTLDDMIQFRSQVLRELEQTSGA